MEALVWLLDQGVDPNVRNAKGHSALTTAIRENRVEMIDLLLNRGADPNKRGAPTGHVVPIRELRLSAGAEFVVVVTGEIMTMPGLPSVPAANSIRLDEKGQIQGLF